MEKETDMAIKYIGRGKDRHQRNTAGSEKLKEIKTCKSLRNHRAWGNGRGVL